MGKITEPVFVAGHRGLMGSALLRLLHQRGYHTVTVERQQVDLQDGRAVHEYLAAVRPRWVLLAAARVGGIQANSGRPAEFLLENLQIQTNVIQASLQTGVEKLIFPGSNCMYPRQASQPMAESCLLTGPLEPTNQAYAVAKIAGVEMCRAFHAQYGADYMAVVPATLYGPNDNYRPDHAHVLPMLLRRFHDAKVAGNRRVTVWGTGRPMREFLYVEDMAEAFLFLMENCHADQTSPLLNVGGGTEVSIAELASRLRDVVGFEGELAFDTTKPDGMPRKLLDSSRLFELGWRPHTDLMTGLRRTYEDFLHNTDLRK